MHFVVLRDNVAAPQRSLLHQAAQAHGQAAEAPGHARRRRRRAGARRDPALDAQARRGQGQRLEVCKEGEAHSRGGGRGAGKHPGAV